MDWITPIITPAGTFLTGLITNITSAFAGLFITGTGETAAPSELAVFLLSVVGIGVAFFILGFAYKILSNLVRRKRV